jgi:hypothetical protein
MTALPLNGGSIMPLNPRERALVLGTIRRIVTAVQIDGGVVYAADQAHRLSVTYPHAGLSEAEIYARLVRLARTLRMPLDSDWKPGDGRPESRGDGQPVSPAVTDGKGGDRPADRFPRGRNQV